MNNIELYNKILNILINQELYEKAAKLRDTFSEKEVIELTYNQCEEIEFFWFCMLDNFGEYDDGDDGDECMEDNIDSNENQIFE